MKHTKKLLSLLLVLCLILSLSCTAFAADEAKPLAGKTVILHSNDVHGAIDLYAAMASMKADYEAQGAEVILADALLANLDGTFYEWLTKNKDGWESNIGKIVDDEKILYAHGLEPAIESSSNNCLYGIRLNLDSVEQNIRTPDKLRQEKGVLEEHDSELGDEIFSISESSEEEASKISTRAAESLAPIRIKLASLKIEAEKIPIRRQNLQNELHSLDMEEQEIIAREHDIRQQTYNNAVLNRQLQGA